MKLGYFVLCKNITHHFCELVKMGLLDQANVSRFHRNVIICCYIASFSYTSAPKLWTKLYFQSLYTLLLWSQSPHILKVTPLSILFCRSQPEKNIPEDRGNILDRTDRNCLSTQLLEKFVVILAFHPIGNKVHYV